MSEYEGKNILINQPARNAPPFISKLLNPGSPLPPGTRFIPAGLDAVPVLGFVFYLFCGLTALFVWSAVRTGLRVAAGDDPAGYLIVAVFLILLFAALAAGTFLRREKARRIDELHRRGQWRQGVFLIPKGVVQYDGRSVCFFPKKRIRQVKYETMGSKESKRTYCFLSFEDDEGGEGVYRLLPPAGDDLTVSQWFG